MSYCHRFPFDALHGADAGPAQPRRLDDPGTFGEFGADSLGFVAGQWLLADRLPALRPELACPSEPRPDPLLDDRALELGEDAQHLKERAAVVDAFATVPRELFFGPGPWRILSPMRSTGYWTTDNADPRHLYHDVLIAIDEERRLNNGQPSLWAHLFDQLGLTRDGHVVHIGTGTGYYSAILAEIVGPNGHVTAVEIDPNLAARARNNLATAWPQAGVVVANGFTFHPDRPADAIIVSAGVTHISTAWLDALAADNGTDA